MTHRTGIPSIWFSILICFLLLLTACTGARRLTETERKQFQPNIAVVQEGRTVSPPGTGQRPPEYRIGVLDELEVRVRFHDRYNDTVKVRPDGRITLIDVGDIYVAGMTPTELDRVITGAYAEVVHDPEVTVIVREFASLSVYVFGEIKDPGAYDFRPNMTILQVLATAGGPIRGAQLGSIILLRRLETQHPEAIALNLSSGAIKSGTLQDVYIQPRDIIYVPKTFISSATQFLDQVYDGILPPIDTYIRALRTFDAIRQE